MIDRLTLETELEQARQSGDFAAQGRLLMRLGDLARGEEEYSLAQGLYGQAWTAHNHAGDVKNAIRAKLALVSVFADLWWNRGEFQARAAAQALCDEIIRDSVLAKDYSSQGRALKVKADLISMDDDFSIYQHGETQKRLYTESLTLCQQGQDRIGQANALIELGLLDNLDSETEHQAQGFFKRAFYLYRQDKFHDGEATALMRIAHDARSSHKGVLSKNFYRLAASIYEGNRQWSKAAQVFNDLGDLVSKEKQYDLAWYYHEKALTLYETYLIDTTDYETTLSSLAHVAFWQQDYKKAIFYTMRDLDVCDENDTMVLSGRLFFLAHIYAASGDVAIGRPYAEQAITISTNHPEQDHLEYRIWWRWHWGQAEHKAGYFERGCSLCCEAIAVARAMPHGYGDHLCPQWEQELADTGCPSCTVESEQ